MYRLGKRSKKRLEGVNEELIAVVERAIEITSQDFSVIEGIRTKERQIMLVRTGKSKTLHSRHIIGKAVDLAPYFKETGINWNLINFFPVAEAMRNAAREIGVVLRWGAAWHMNMDKYERTTQAAKNDYVELRRSQSRIPFIDAPHFELPRKK